MAGMYVHFEGLDLAGKSTICRRYCKVVPGDWTTRHNALDPENPVWRLADELRRTDAYDQGTIGWLFLAALRADLERYERPAGNTLQDSTILLRSLAYHTAAGTPGLPEAFEALLERHPRFDRSFVLVCRREVRLHRLRTRRKENLSPEDFLVRDDPDRFQRMEDVLVDHATRWFDAKVLDTSRLEDDPEGARLLEQFPELA